MMGTAGARRFEWLAALRDDAAEWCEGRSWIPRAALLAYLVWLFVHYLFDPDYGSIFSGINLGIHELSHVITSFLPQFLTSLAGSVGQVAAPIVAVVLFARQRDYFGAAVALLWCSYSMFEVASYMSDSRALSKPLLSLAGQYEAGDPTGHDWHNIFSTLGILKLDRAIGALTRVVAALVGFAGTTAGAWLCWRMAFRARVTD